MPRDGDLRSFRQSLNSRFRTFAATHPGRSPQDLQQQFAYDRLLARVFSGPHPDLWILKGSTALLARLSGVGRHTQDIDLYHAGEVDVVDAERALQQAIKVDLGDSFRFILGPAQAIATARRIPVEALLGVTTFAKFPIDLVTGLSMTGEPDLVDPPLPEIPGIVRVPYRAYPLVDHIADKVCALHEFHPRGGGTVVPSTRYRDVVDLLVIARALAVDALPLSHAIRSEESRRGLTLPREIVPPRGYDWEAGYSTVARRSPGVPDADLATAIRVISAFLNPVLDDSAVGHWNPATLSWDGTS